MDKMIEIYLRGKILDFIRKSIEKLELTEKGKKGIEKMQMLLNNFWDNATVMILKEKENDIKFMPNFIENFAEDTILDVIEILKEEFDIKSIAQEIFDLENK